MSDDIEKHKTELEQLGRLERLVDRYAQSRVLPLLIPLAMMVVNIVLLLSAGKVASLLIFHLQIDMSWFTVIIIGVIVWVIVSSTWVTAKLIARYGDWPYKKEGVIKLREERVPIWAWIAYLITLLGPTFLSVFSIMPVRWAIAVALTSFGSFMLYVGKKHKEKALGIVLGGLCLAESGLTAGGVYIQFENADWLYSYFIPLMMYLVGNGLITTVVVHIYNRRVLHKLKGMRPFDEQESNKSDS